MTAQDNTATNLSYPVDNAAPVTPTPSMPIPMPATPTDTPVGQTVDDLDPNRGQQISGPSFDGLPEAPAQPVVLTPTSENTSGAMSDLVPPMPTDMNNPAPTPVSLDPASPIVNDMPAMDAPVVAPEAAMPTVETPAPENTDVKEEGKDDKEEKKESPLQALARKLSELKSELIEDGSAKEDEKKDAVTEPGATPTENTVAPETPTLETPVAPVMAAPVTSDIQAQMTVPSMETPLVMPDAPAMPTDTPAVPDLTTSALDSTSSALPTNDILQAPSVDTGVTDPAMNTMPVMDTPVVAPEVAMPTVETPAPATETPSEPDATFDPLAEFQASMSENQTETPISEPTIPVESAPVVTEPASPTPVIPIVEDTSAVIDENAKDSLTPQDVEANTPSQGKYPLSINKILDLAIERNASDIHITVGYPVMIRVDGSLLALHEQILSSENAEELVFPLLSEQKKELLEVNREIDFAHTHRHGGEARFRINAYYTMQNLAAALRLIPTRIRTIEELNLPPIYTQFAGLKQGLVLVTGPTGHGKSTTLAAILQHVNVNRSAHMLTIEDPIEYVFPKARAVVDQREMHDDTHSWAVALKSALRQDPDVILVGEMRDYETIAATITLAETGHLVFATLHTNSAAQTIDRIIDVFPENQQGQVRAQLANILEAVVAQRLIPIDGGGRRAVSEIMIGSTAVKNLIREGKTHQLDNVIRTSADIGMISLEHSLVKLVREGLITMDKAQEYAVHPEEVVRLLKS